MELCIILCTLLMKQKFQFSRLLFGYVLLIVLYRYINVLLKRVAQGNTIIYSPSRKAFYSRKQGSQPAPFKAENYTDSTGERIYVYPLC